MAEPVRRKVRPALSTARMEAHMTNDPARYPQRLFWLCFAVAMVDGFDTLVVSFIAPAFAAEWSLSGTEVGQVFGIGLVGAAIGGIIGGRLADRAGRKKVLLGSVLLFSVLTVCCALAPNREILMALRFLAGLGLGAAIPTVTALTAETLPPEQRTAAVTRMFLGFPLGAVIGGALCAIMVEPLGWRSATAAVGSRHRRQPMSHLAGTTKADSRAGRVPV